MSSSGFNLCSNWHDEICFIERECPACHYRRQAEANEKKIDDLEERLSDLSDEVMDFEKQISDLEGKINDLIKGKNEHYTPPANP